ncbi:MAG: ParB N-terminal domain-containing protein [Treponema sp.]|jgi:ParB family chromosome partitioning protein|nr:ParB N-terminal domain-containing protein [Treponema sp.]
MKISIESIIVKNRIRKDMGDIADLAESLKKYGQISPIAINKKNELIAGGRRLEAAKLLGWESIEVTVVDVHGKLEQLEMEMEENIQRREFNPAELADASEKLYRLRHPGFFRRILNAITRFFKKIFRIDD